MDITANPVAGGMVVTLQGEIDLYSSPRVRERLLGLLKERPSRLIVDLSAVPYMDSSGIATFVETLQQVRKQQGVLRLVGLQANIREVFRFARLEQVFAICDTVDAAMA
jgi:anti-sigma B factor antagonist